MYLCERFFGSRIWLSDLPLLPPSEQLQAEEEAAFVLENVFFPKLNECDVHELATYVNIWLEGSLHDLSREARQKRALYIELLEVAKDKEVRQLAEALKEQRRRICEREPLDEMATEWWQQRQEGHDVQRLWQQWRLKNDNKLWAGLRLIDSLLRQMPGDLYGDIGQMDVVLSRLYYLNTPRRAKTIEAFNRLPEEFTIDDVMRCFGLAQNNSARARVFRLQKDGLVEKVDEFVDNGTTKAKYKKTGAVMI